MPETSSQPVQERRSLSDIPPTALPHLPAFCLVFAVPEECEGNVSPLPLALMEGDMLMLMLMKFSVVQLGAREIKGR